MSDHSSHAQLASATTTRLARPPLAPPHGEPALDTRRMDQSMPAHTPTPTRVMVVDDHIVVRNGIAFSLLAYGDIEVVAQAGSGEEALRVYAESAESEQTPDVVLMDLMMPGMGGVATIRALHAVNSQAQVIVLTSYQEGNLVEEALQAGAIGYLLKDVSVEDLAKAIRLAVRGMPILAPEAAQSLVHSVTRRPPAIGHDLTEREREVLALLAEGLSNQAIAEQLVITPATVKFHTRSIRSKLGTTSRTETVVLALNNHLVPTAT